MYVNAKFSENRNTTEHVNVDKICTSLHRSGFSVELPAISDNA